MKKIFFIGVAILMIFSALYISASAQSGEIDVYLDGEKIEFDVSPQIINGRTMVPIRAIFEKMGANVNWNNETRTATCVKENTVVEMTVDSEYVVVNGQYKEMDTTPVIVDGRTLAPARYVAEAFGATVNWSQKNNAVVICSKDVYAYVDYPDIPDLGKCYNIPLLSETDEDGFKMLTYLYSDMENDDYYSYLYDNSAVVLGEYVEEVEESDADFVLISYTKGGEIEPSYFIGASYDYSGNMEFVVLIPLNEVAETVENNVTLYASDGRTIEVAESDVPAYLNVGWYRTFAEADAVNKKVTLYASDGRTIEVAESDVSAYLNVGWYRTFAEADAVNKPSKSPSDSSSYNPSPNGNYYRTPTGKKYHLDPNCGGKNSYKTTNISGLSPCKKCAQ